ncbi:UDP-N-acetyl-2-amino-2-deoxyglucuronate dehydrogenase [Tindallia magadiensis]|uniref:UDP-N-acetyl-2-amino-2-deoxyglucuronate dehydrogenase n=1 Tax=Tindallia magadiensis TaxID=69895 RepID=A0A1I3D2V8_9FIRM|nr:Gfo/Idh/MocA family oxidoreductase [Tindallia magadiensis]SFH80996.1 UDP-N-acetyl-2-amino-2-deoxyglucuronate dehydrogenase [Tindallia magadiensis]
MFNFALIGCGRISQNHIDALAKHSDQAKIIAVCDIVPDRAQNVAKKTGAQAYTSYAELLERTDLDAVILCTPSGLHPEHGIMAAQKGIHVITEKPMGTNLKKADELIKACDDHNVHLFVVKQNRLNTTLQLLKKAIDKERFGRIYMANVNVFWTRPQDYYDQAKWRGTWEFDGGAFMNQASHYVDMLEWFMGPVESVMAYTSTMARKIETEDTGVAALKFRNGALGSMNVTMLTYPKNYEGSITILGEKGTVKIGGIAVNKIEQWEFDTYDDDDKEIENMGYTPPNVYGFGHTGYYNNVLEVMNQKAEPDTDGREGRKSLELILAIYKSARENKSIPLPLD